ncbi:MAG: alcohol dehydrogenase catalytic domain-containing protein [bacterium]
MKAAFLTGVKQFEIRQVPDPKILNDTDVLIRMKTVGVCGSDVHYYASGRIGSQIVKFPFIIGHEGSGTVERTGSTVTKVKPGQRIAIEPALSCGRCDQCKAGRENTCRELRFLGNPKQLDGCLSEYIVLHEKCCFPINESMTFEQATLSEPLAIGIYSVERSMIPANATVAILGVGPIGMSVFHVLRTKNVGNVYVTDRIDDRLAFSIMLNPKWFGNPDRMDIVKEISKIEPLLLDVVYECSGNPEAIGQAIQLLKPGGTLVIIGITETDAISFPIHELRRRELTIINIRRQVHCTQKAIDLLDRGQITMDSMATHHFPLEETQKAFDLAANYKDGVMKAIITIE